MDSNETKIYTALLMIAFALAVIVLFFIITLLKHQRKAVGAYKEKVQIEINILEEERKRIARDLHDEIGPLLSIAQMKLSIVKSTDHEDQQILSSVTKNINTSIQQIREITYDLLPTGIEREGLIATLGKLKNHFTDLNRIQIDFYLPDIFLKIEPSKEIHVYRAIREIIHNCIKHAQATYLTLSIEQKTQKIFITVKDNGKGFDFNDTIKNSNGQGLRSIASRVDLLNGELFLDTAPGKGTIYSIEIPIT